MDLLLAPTDSIGAGRLQFALRARDAAPELGPARAGRGMTPMNAETRQRVAGCKRDDVPRPLTAGTEPAENKS
jgi:hypothetical protein